VTMKTTARMTLGHIPGMPIQPAIPDLEDPSILLPRPLRVLTIQSTWHLTMAQTLMYPDPVSYYRMCSLTVERVLLL
jgi:hypothetical protein